MYIISILLHILGYATIVRLRTTRISSKFNNSRSIIAQKWGGGGGGGGPEAPPPSVYMQSCFMVARILIGDTVDTGS